MAAKTGSCDPSGAHVTAAAAFAASTSVVVLVMLFSTSCWITASPRAPAAAEAVSLPFAASIRKHLFTPPTLSSNDLLHPHEIDLFGPACAKSGLSGRPP